MAELPAIDDSNTFPDKTEGGDVGEPTDVVSAADLNALKTVVGENRSQANAALAATAGEVTQRTASFSLAAADHGRLQELDSSAGASVITVPHTLWGSVYPSGQFKARIFVTNADEAVTIAGSGGLALTYFGRNVIKTGDLITITVRSATFALVEVQPWGDALLPLDGGTVTDPTRTLGVADATQIIGLDPTSNAIEVTIPHTLFWAGGLGRTFQCTLVALNVTNAITLVGSGGLGLVYYGSSTITAGDIIRVSVESATVCRVEVLKSGAATGIPSAQIDYIRADGNWTKPAGAKSIYVRCVGTGGPGAGGPVQTGATARAGGAGGGGGAVAEATFDAALITSPVACLVGAAPTGGAGRSGSTGDGSAGSGAGPTSFGSYLSAYAGGAGRIGTATAALGAGGGGGGTGSAGADGAVANAANGGAPGAAATTTAVGGGGAAGNGNQSGGRAEYGGGGGGGRTATPLGFAGGGSIYGGGGGGCGGSASAAPAIIVAQAGGASGSYTAGTGGVAGTSGASPTAGTGGADGDGMTRCGSGGGGGGSTVAANANGADGGEGGDWGGGGGGGGAGEGSGNGGNGGAGGLGGIIVITYF